MKYPQLVSTRAVSAISDWLVTQLEQLGVDASLVYSRLLLSLLHTPLQINALDLAELSEIKVGNSSRKILNTVPNYRRFSATDSEAIKRLAAIDSLVEAVSSDQKISKIERLIDELSEKLREIEQQNQLDESLCDDLTDESNNVNVNTFEKEPATQEDPAKRYYRAFPALSNEISSEKSSFMRSSVFWPRPDKQSVDTITNQAINLTNPDEGNASTKKKPKRKRSSNSMITSQTKPFNSGNRSHQVNNNNNIRQKTQTTSNITNNVKKSLSDCWDTNFEGSWEMGRDLIHEFIIKQDKSKIRNMNSDKQNMMQANIDVNSRPQNNNNNQFNAIGNVKTMGEEEELNSMKVAAACSAFIGTQISACSNTSDSGTFSSIADSNGHLTADAHNYFSVSHDSIPSDTFAPFSEFDRHAFNTQRRLYERETSFESINRIVDKSMNDEITHLAAFEAKFDRNVEALWDNENEVDAANNVDSICSVRVVAVDVPHTNKSFWTNYYKHQYNNNIDDSQMYSNQMQTTVSMPFMEKLNDESKIIQSCFKDAAGQTIGSGVNLTASIWSDVPNNNQDDVSFYANNKQWENDYKNDEQFNINKMGNESENCVESQQKYFSMPPMKSNNHQSSSICYGETFLDTKKWSENASDMPLGVSCDTSMIAKQDKKIRNNLFQNSYLNDYNAITAINIESNVDQSTKSSAEEFLNIQQISEQQNDVMMEITLANHSIHSSFKAVKRSLTKSLIASNSCANIEPPQPSPPPQCDDEQENLLTSDKTHFCPIKQTYPDGYTFDISDEWDQITYERSASGTMYLESEIYREYYVYDEDGNGGRLRVKDSPISNQSTNSTPFILKYCVKQNEKSCQTDSNPLRNSSALKNFKILRARPQHNDMRHREQKNIISDETSMDLIGNNLLDMDDWTMTEYQRKCNNNIEKVHALWEHCDACSNDIVSMPANRLLRDELSADGDEIMSDLKYMQNLYIGNDWDDDDNDNKMIVDRTVDYDDGLLIPHKANSNETINYSNIGTVDGKNDEVDDDDGYSDAQTKHIYYNVNKIISDLLQPDKAMTLVQAISEKCNNQIVRLSINDKQNNNDCIDNNNKIDANTIGGLWVSNDNSIWRKDSSNEHQHQSHQTQNTSSNQIIHDNKMNKLEKNECNQSDRMKTLSNDANTVAQKWDHANLEKIWTSENQPNDETNFHRERIKESKMEINQRQQQQQQQQPYTISVDNEEALQKFVDLANNQTKIRTELNETAPENESMKTAPNIRNRYDRKRRHSATSQNVYETSVYILRPRERIDCEKKLVTNEIECDRSTNNNETSSVLNFITCKYWTTDLACINDKHNDNNNNQNFNINYMPIDHVNIGTEAIPLHPTSLLKQVAAMVARPLTR